jgi:hypothetical protein
MARFRSHLATAVERGEIGPMTPQEVDAEIRTLFALVDGLELQWLLEPELDRVAAFSHSLDNMITRWRTSRAATSSC